MSDLVIRRPSPADEPEWRRLWTGYLEFYETSVPEEVYRSTWARLLSEAEGDCHAFLAVAGGRPVGLVHYIYHRHNWRIEKVTYLQDLYVDPEVRGTGAGRALIEAVYAAADEAGCPSVYWMTQDYNATARKLYNRIAKLTPFIKYQR